MKPTRRDLLVLGGGMAAGAAVSTWLSPERRTRRGAAGAAVVSSGDEEYVWVSANANLALFTGRDHPALYKIGKELGVQVSIAGPNTVDIPGLVAAIEQTAARRPAGMMVVGWDSHALIPAINKAMESGVPVVCVDADVPESKRLSFIGTDWTELGVRQGEAMVKQLQGRRGEVGLLGMVEQSIDQQAVEGFRSVALKAGLTVLEPQQDHGNQAEATRVASALLQARPNLVGLAGFDSESGPGMGLAVREAGRAGKLVLTCVETTDQHLRLLKEGVLTACIGQKRELFTYYGVKALYEYVHASLQTTADDRRAGVSPIPVNYSTGTYTVTRDNVDFFLKGKG
ncbi:MAG TPA: substrate-binding domain-containing protein [Planctomycetota bacterium]|nr:substrate-binding domain-containing protein [Planctomycetota bacterium]